MTGGGFDHSVVIRPHARTNRQLDVASSTAQYSTSAQIVVVVVVEDVSAPPAPVAIALLLLLLLPTTTSAQEVNAGLCNTNWWSMGSPSSHSGFTTSPGACRASRHALTASRTIDATKQPTKQPTNQPADCTHSTQAKDRVISNVSQPNRHPRPMGSQHSSMYEWTGGPYFQTTRAK